MPDQTDQRKDGFGATKLILIKELGGRPNLPMRRSLHDGIKKYVPGMVAGVVSQRWSWGTVNTREQLVGLGPGAKKDGDPLLLPGTFA